MKLVKGIKKAVAKEEPYRKQESKKQSKGVKNDK
jgi:hypothetical protein